VVIGLGKLRSIDRLTIHWPSGRVQELRGLKAGAHTIEEPKK
jgi:hypothetical protein